MSDSDVMELADFVTARFRACLPAVQADAVIDVVRSIEGGAYEGSLFTGRNPTLPILCREWLESLAVAFDDHSDYREAWRP